MAIIETGRVGVDGLEVYYERHAAWPGSEQGAEATPVLLLHGGMMAIDVAYPEGFIARLARLGPVIAVEQQGHGHTADRPGPARIDRMVADTAGVLAGLGIARAHVVGHSLGAVIGLGLAIRHADRVASLAAVSGFSRLEGMLPGLVTLQRDPGHVPSAALLPLLPTEHDFARWQESHRRHAPDPDGFLTVLEKLNAMLARWEGWEDDDLRAITAPVLVAIGDTDFTRIDHAATMAALIPGAALAVLPDTRHMDILSRMDWLVPMIEATHARARG